MYLLPTNTILKTNFASVFYLPYVVGKNYLSLINIGTLTPGIINEAIAKYRVEIETLHKI